MSAKPEAAAHAFLKGMGAGSARRAPTVMQLVYARIEELKRRDQNLAAPDPEAKLSHPSNQAYLSAIVSGAQSDRPAHTIQDIERFSGSWGELVPKAPELRAAIAHILAKSHRFSRSVTPGITAALSLDDPKVWDAYEVQRNAPLSEIYTDDLSVSERLVWRSNRIAIWLENLPPFWASFALTVTSTMGPGVLALPIILAAFGPLVATLIVLVTGGVSALTVGYLAEAHVRAGRIGKTAGFGEMIEGYLGKAAAHFVRTCMLLYCVLVLFTYCGGFAQIIEIATGFSGFIFIGLLMVFGLWFISPSNQSSSLSSALFIGIINTLIVASFIIGAVALIAIDPPSLEIAWLPKSWPTDHAIYQIAFGAPLYIFAGHISISNGASYVLPRDPTGKGYVRGAVAGMTTLTVLYAIWCILSVATPTDGITNYGNGELLQQLAERLGPAAYWAGVLFIVLTLGMGSANYALGVRNLVVEIIGEITKRFASSAVNKVAFQKSNRMVAMIPATLILLTMGWAGWINYKGGFVLTELFGTIGGLMPPIVAGTFPVLILLAVRAKGVASMAGLWSFLSHRVSLIAVFVFFCSFYFVQGIILDGVLWVQISQVILLALVLVITANLVRRGAFKPATVVTLERGEDGWAFDGIKVFHAGNLQPIESVAWQLRSTLEFEELTEKTGAAKTIHAIRIGLLGQNHSTSDVTAYDRTTGRPLDFTAKIVPDDKSPRNADTLRFNLLVEFPTIR